MNAVEIEQAISDLALQPFDPAEFAYAFLESFGNKATTIKRLRSGTSNKSDLGGVLQTNNIHIAVAEAGAVTQMLEALKASPATSRAKARFILATDGESFEAEDLETGETIACDYEAFPDHFGFFLPLAGITTVKQLRDSSFDIRATSRLNRLYVELLKDNPSWGTEEHREEMNHFMARLIFCFFAEDTDIFSGSSLFTDTVAQMSTRDSVNTHEVISEIFRAMNTKQAERAAAGIPRWADAFPYVNGGLFSGSAAVPEFSKIARSYLLHIGGLDWTQINPDIFGSMIQAIADDEERGALGMHYTSVPNILKVLNPLFLDDLREKLNEAGDNSRKLLNLRNRMARIRVFDPACGSGNFLVIAYKQMREIEAEINQRRGEPDRPTDIPLTNFRGIELRNFSAEIARLALIIAEYQCNVQYRGKQLALNEFLPLSADNWITCGNALRLDWLAICPPTGTGVKLVANDLFETPLDQAQIDFENEGGKPLFVGIRHIWEALGKVQSKKADLESIFAKRVKNWKSLDYVAGWFMKAAGYSRHTPSTAAFVSTNSICQGQQVPILWPAVFATGNEITFAHTSFKWANLASHNAGVTVVIIAISNHVPKLRRLFSIADDGATIEKQAELINAYLVSGQNIIVSPLSKPLDERGLMEWGNKPTDGGNLFLSAGEREAVLHKSPEAAHFIKRFLGAQEFIRGEQRYCLWIEDSERADAETIPELKRRIEAVAEMRAASKAAETRPAAAFPHRFRQIQSTAKKYSLVVARVSSENREYLPIGLEDSRTIIGDRNFALYDAPLWNMALIASRLHWIWIGTVCVRMRTDFSYSNTLGWNTFPVPTLTEKNKADLTRCAEEILLAREAHFPATIAGLYNPDTMPENLRTAHDRNDEVLERIYIGRRFKNDTERLEKLFELYTKMTEKPLRGKGMKEFNRMTIVAASEVVSSYCSHSDMEALELQWGIEDGADRTSKTARAASWARIAINENMDVMTEQGRAPLARAIVEKAVIAPKDKRGSSWVKFIAGLRFDGFEVVEPVQSAPTEWGWVDSVNNKAEANQITLIRMLPEDKGLDFREAENEVSVLLKEFGFDTAKGHLEQALSAFQRGEWSSANGELRNFFENYLNEIADALGHSGKDDSKLKRDFLGGAEAAFLFAEYNEWNSDNQKPQYVQGLMSRMHPHGGHPGLSEEEDATFRLQIMLITARLFLRRFKQRKDNL